MSCKQTPMLQRLAVESPAALDAPSWKDHLETCQMCRQERYALERSLAIFKQFESQPPPLSGPSWETMAAAIRRQRRGPLGRVRVPLAAASLLVAVSSGLLLWPNTQLPSEPRPAKIVTLQPEQQARLQQVLHSSLQTSANVAQRVPTHQSPAISRRPAVRFRLLDRLGVQPVNVEFVSNPVSGNSGDAGIFAPTEGERGAMALYGPQAPTERAPIELLPVVAPVQSGSGAVSPRTLLTPRPIR